MGSRTQLPTARWLYAPVAPLLDRLDRAQSMRAVGKEDRRPRKDPTNTMADPVRAHVAMSSSQSARTSLRSQMLTTATRDGDLCGNQNFTAGSNIRVVLDADATPASDATCRREMT